MSLSAGKHLGPFEVLGPLGTGGMGEVYRARDTRLDRTVAIKVLPEHLARNPDLRARFEREARAGSSLNHPHICTLHDVGQQDGIDYLVMELVEGETLLDRLKKGPLTLDQTLRYGIEIADALEKAHRHGVIHRDLKPGNVMLTKAGSKLMDFGLAKRGPSGGGAGSVSTLETREKPLTEAGSVLGTYQYMSPEQLEGKDADARSDIWALGCVLYEMATGRRAFEGKSQASLISAILKDEPQPIVQLQPMAPPTLDRLVRVCLAKDPDDRLQTAHDVMQELKWIGEAPTGDRPARHKNRERVVWALAIVLAGFAGWWLGPRREATRGHGSLRIAEALRFTHENGIFESPSWSPDGKLVAFASNRTGNFEIYVRRADGGEEINVSQNPSEDIQPAFSPDGRSIAFVSTRSSRTGVVPISSMHGLDLRTFGGDLWLMPALGGNARRLSPDANYPAWRPDGGAILYVGGPEDRRSLHEVSPDGSSSREVLSSAHSNLEIMRPHYSPDGRWIAFGYPNEATVYVLPAAGGQARVLLTATDQAWADDGSLFLVRRGPAGGTTIGRVAMDSMAHVISGSEEVVAVLTGTMRDLAVAPGRTSLALSEFDAGMNLTRLPLSADGRRTAGPEQALSAGSERDRYPAYDADGRRLAYSSNRAGPDEVWVLDLKTMRQERLPVPQDGLVTQMPCWLPDGNGLLVKRSSLGGQASLWLLSLDGSHAEQLMKPGEVTMGGTHAVSPDGRRALVQRLDDTGRQLYEIDLATRAQRRVTATPGNKYDPFWSRDGRQVAYFADTDGTLQLWAQPSDGGEARQLTFGVERTRHGSFSHDGRWIYFQKSHKNIWRVPAAGGAVEQVTSLPESGLFLEEPTLSPDGRSLVYSRWNGGASLWLLSLGSREGPAPSP